ILKFNKLQDIWIIDGVPYIRRRLINHNSKLSIPLPNHSLLSSLLPLSLSSRTLTITRKTSNSSFSLNLHNDILKSLSDSCELRSEGGVIDPTIRHDLTKFLSHSSRNLRSHMLISDIR